MHQKCTTSATAHGRQLRTRPRSASQRRAQFVHIVFCGTLVLCGMINFRSTTVITTLLLTSACTDEALPATPVQQPPGAVAPDASSPIVTPPDNDAALPLPPGTPTFYGEVAPILAQRCVTCHQAGGIGPFALIEYREVAPLAKLIASSTASRRMPPFLPDNSGDCATYEDAMWLSDEELATLQAWSDAGAPEGDRARGLPPLPELPRLAEPNHEASMAEAYMPSGSEQDDYRCFLLDDDIEGTEPAFLTDYEVVAGDSRVVHHVIVFQPTTESVVTELRALDDKEAGPGYPCYGGVGSLSARMLMNWAPGTGAVHHPEGTGVAIDPALPMVMQVHYNVANGSFPDRTTLRLKTTGSVTYPMRPWFVTDGQLNLQPKQEKIDKHIDMPVLGLSFLYGAITKPLFDNGPLMIMGVRAHMHELGTTMRVERKAFGGDTACLVNIPRYDFGWQRSYFLEKPVPLESLDAVQVHCTYNTMARDTVVTFGESTSDEMCLATLYTIEASAYP